MKTKIISINKKYSSIEKQIPLTSLMITTLVAACEKQSKGITFGPRDIKGSFIALVSRGLILVKNPKNITSNKYSDWHVSDEAIGMLKAMVIKIKC